MSAAAPAPASRLDPRLLDEVAEALAVGMAVPYLGSGCVAAGSQPDSLEALATLLNGRVAVPRRLHGNACATAQYIENFRHRRTLDGLMGEAFPPGAGVSPAQRFVAGLAQLPLVVHAWYDDGLRAALAGRPGWGEVVAETRAHGGGGWFAHRRPDGTTCDADEAAGWSTLLYRPMGGLSPEGSFLVSDSDFVEVLTEIDIQTPIPPEVQARRRGRGFLFLGCRFASQLERSYARQVSKRSDSRHYAVLPFMELTRNESRFLIEHNIEPIDLPLPAFLAEMEARLPGV